MTLLHEYLVEAKTEERARALLREAEQSHLLYEGRDSGKAQVRWLPTALTLGSLLGLIAAKLS
jgi:hypothetical protein